MSQVEAPAEEQKVAKKKPQPEPKPKPDETQEPSAGASQEMHETALRTEDGSEEFKKAIAQAIQDQFNVTDAWKPRKVIKFIVPCPSGQQALVKHLSTMDLIRADLIEDLDSFQRKLFPAELDDQGRPVERNSGLTFFKMMSDPERRVKFLDVTARLMSVCSVKPRIINDGVALVDTDTYKQIFGEEPANDDELHDVFGYQVESIDHQIKLFGKPVPLVKDGEAYAGVIDLPDRFAFFTELNKPLELIAPFREPSESLSDLATVSENGDSAK